MMPGNFSKLGLAQRAPRWKGEQMFESIDRVAASLRDVLDRLDGALMTGLQAAEGVRRFAEVERLAAAGRALLAARVDETRAWDGGGHSSAAEWMASVSGTTIGAAISLLDTSRELGKQPDVAGALRDGQLSTAQAALISGALKSAPDAAAELLAEANGSSVSHLADVCRAVKARAEDPNARAERHRRSRRAWFGTDPDGMVELRALLPVAAGAAVRTVLEKRTDQIFRERRRDEEREPRDRYMADALVELVRGGVVTGNERRARPVRTNVQVRVDLAALRRGSVADGEICDAPGVGELTVGEVEALMAEDDVVIDALLTRGHDVLKTVRLDRYVTAEMRKALSFRDATCVVPGCGRKWRLEKDHLKGGYAKTRRTKLDELAHLCPHHHRLKTRGGWILSWSEDTGWSFDLPEERSRGA